jgi:hypothetical protein
VATVQRRPFANVIGTGKVPNWVVKVNTQVFRPGPPCSGLVCAWASRADAALTITSAAMETIEVGKRIESSGCRQTSARIVR